MNDNEAIMKWLCEKVMKILVNNDSSLTPKKSLTNERTNERSEKKREENRILIIISHLN